MSLTAPEGDGSFWISPFCLAGETSGDPTEVLRPGDTAGVEEHI